MKYWIGIVLITWASIAPAEQKVSRRIMKGDPITEVYQRHGTPTLEYPLNGRLIQEYQGCMIVSSNGVVISAEYKEPEPSAEPNTADEAAPTMEEIQQSAAQGNAESQYTLAFCYQFGRFVEQDYGAAVTWYTRSAMQGYMPAQHNLGYLYMKGRGVEQDMEQSYAWALLAAAGGNDTLKRSLDFIITDDQKHAAEQRADQIRALIPANRKSGD